MANVALKDDSKTLKMENHPSEQYSFSVELKSKRDLKNVTMTNGLLESMVIEGAFGELVRTQVAEGLVLKAIGEKGILRLDNRENEIQDANQKTAGKAKKQ